MAKIEILLPAMGEGIIDATITKWLVNIGDKVEEDQSIVEIATDKVDSEIPAPQEGVIKELLLEEGSVPKVGETIAIIEIEGEDNHEATSEIKETALAIKKEEITTNEVIQETVITPTNSSSDRFLSPLVRSIIKKENIPFDDINKMRGTSNT